MSSARLLRVGLITAAVFAVSLCSVAVAAARTLYVAQGGSGSNCTKKAPCGTISAAVAKAHRNDTVSVAQGTYKEDVAIGNAVRVVGVGLPVVDASGLDNGFLITGRHVLVRGFDVKNATFEGILAKNTRDVRIEQNVIENNDQGVGATTPTGECAPQGPIPGDCGEGLHLWSVTHSRVVDNLVQNNAGGILLTDESGPTAFNVISQNRALNNLLDCGITLAGHSTLAASTATGKPNPKAAGVYHNTISRNVANGNGIDGEGGGILLAAGAPGSAVYNNDVINNTANGNDLAGVTLHSHSPGQDLNGNHIIGNKVSNDGLHFSKGGVSGVCGGAPVGDPDFCVPGTVGITVASAVTKLKGIVISGNKISAVHFGIWTKNAPKLKPKSNKFTNVVDPTQT